MFRKQRGSLSVEAAIILVIFIFGYAAIVSVTSFIHAQMIIQYGIGQAAKEISSYCYLVSKTGIMDNFSDIHKNSDTFKTDTDKVIDTVMKLYDAVDNGASDIKNTVKSIPEVDGLESLENLKQNISNFTEEDCGEIVTAANNMISSFKESEYYNKPTNLLKGLVVLAKDEVFSAAKSFALAAPISRALTKNQIELYGTNSKGQDILETLGVVDGFDGLNFVGSTLFNDGKTITVQVSYTMKVRFHYFDKKEFHFTQTASTKAWGSGTGGRPWRK